MLQLLLISQHNKTTQYVPSLPGEASHAAPSIYFTTHGLLYCLHYISSLSFAFPPPSHASVNTPAQRRDLVATLDSTAALMVPQTRGTAEEVGVVSSIWRVIDGHAYVGARVCIAVPGDNPSADDGVTAAVQRLALPDPPATGAWGLPAGAAGIPHGHALSRASGPPSTRALSDTLPSAPGIPQLSKLSTLSMPANTSVDDADRGGNLGSVASAATRMPVTHLTLLIKLRDQPPLPADRPRDAHAVYEATARALLAALLTEQQRTLYVKQQVHALLAARETWAVGNASGPVGSVTSERTAQLASSVDGMSGHPSASGALHARSSSMAGVADLQEPYELVQAQLACSSLANELASVLSLLAAGLFGVVPLSRNGWLAVPSRVAWPAMVQQPALSSHITMVCPRDLAQPTLRSVMSSALAEDVPRGHLGHQLVRGSRLMLSSALLLRAAPQELLDVLPGQSSPHLAAVVQHASPWLSLQDVASMAALPYSTVLSAAAQLVAWGVATLIDVMDDSSRFTLAALHPSEVRSAQQDGGWSEAAGLLSDQAWLKAWAAAFPETPAADLAERFRPGTSLGNLTAALSGEERARIRTATAALLQCGVLCVAEDRLLLLAGTHMPPELATHIAQAGVAGAAAGAVAPHGCACPVSLDQRAPAVVLELPSAQLLDTTKRWASEQVALRLSGPLSSAQGHAEAMGATLASVLPWCDGTHTMTRVAKLSGQPVSSIKALCSIMPDVVVTVRSSECMC